MRKRRKPLPSNTSILRSARASTSRQPIALAFRRVLAGKPLSEAQWRLVNRWKHEQTLPSRPRRAQQESTGSYRARVVAYKTKRARLERVRKTDIYRRLSRRVGVARTARTKHGLGSMREGYLKAKKRVLRARERGAIPGQVRIILRSKTTPRKMVYSEYSFRAFVAGVKDGTYDKVAARAFDDFDIETQVMPDIEEPF